MTTTDDMFSIHRVTWSNSEADIRLVRQTVFIDEQSVPQELEWDGEDEYCLHFVARSPSGDPLGTVRLMVDGKIGRLAVLKDWRKKGVGRALLAAVMASALAEGDTRPYLDAQVSALGFYEKFGFVAFGPVFDDAGIPHRRMNLDLGALT